MLGKPSGNPDAVVAVSVEALVPANHVLRRLHAALDLSFVREKVAALYSRFGRPSIDPELVVRMWILQHFYRRAGRLPRRERRPPRWSSKPGVSRAARTKAATP